MIDQTSENVKAVQRMVQRAALEHDCPRCGRRVGEGCVVRSRGVPQVVSGRAKAHASRIDTAFAAGTVRIGETL